MRVALLLLVAGSAQLPHAVYYLDSCPQLRFLSWRHSQVTYNTSAAGLCLLDDELRSASSAVVSRQLCRLKMDEDPRSVGGGTVMIHSGYVDQPYCVVNDRMRGEVQCTVTVGPGHEGGQGEHVSSIWSRDGTNWSQPVRVEPSPLSSSYSNMFLSRFGRLYTIYNFNAENISTLPHGVCAFGPCPAGAPARHDMLGKFMMRYSDTGGRSWCDKRYEVPVRQTWIDRHNTWNGSVNIMWTVDQAKEINDSLLFGFTKIGRYMLDPPLEGFIMHSPNILTERDPSRIVWEMLPEGDVGILAPGTAQGGLGADAFAEEHHVIPLESGKGFNVFFRLGGQGLLGMARTTDPTGRNGWLPSSFARYWLPHFGECSLQPTQLPHNLSATGVLKNPLGPTQVKRMRDGTILLLFYNAMGDILTGADAGIGGRNVLWLSAGRECAGELLWSQPEIAVYGDADLPGQHFGTNAPCYPDIFDTRDGEVLITETNKTTARLHRMPRDLINGIHGQFTAGQFATRGAVLLKKGTMPAPVLASLDTYAPGVGVSVELWLQGHGQATEGQMLLDGRKDGRGLQITVAHPGLNISIADGNAAAELSLDRRCSTVLAMGHHHVAFVLDAAAKILRAMVDGMLCDGGQNATRGWAWAPSLGNVSGASVWHVAPEYAGSSIRGHVWSRALTTSELVGNFRAGKRLSVAKTDDNDSNFSFVWNSAFPWECGNSTSGLNPATMDLAKFGIESNEYNDWYGDTMQLRYCGAPSDDPECPGLWPYFDADGKPHHGGIPQAGNISAHAAKVAADIQRFLPVDFDGFLVIDMEQWYPWALVHQKPEYKNASEDFVRKRHPTWSALKVTQTAASEWQAAAVKWWTVTLQVSTRVRPRAKIGYYEFPGCYAGFASSTQPPGCTNDIQMMNDEMLKPILEASTAFFPSIYLYWPTDASDPASLRILNSRRYVQDELAEAVRVRKALSKHSTPIMAYTMFQTMFDPPNKSLPVHLMPMSELQKEFNTTRQFPGVDGIVLWSSSTSTQTSARCKQMQHYVLNTLGPFIKMLG